jgi:hypothetical protein
MCKESEVIEVPDLSNLSELEKKIMIAELGKISGKAFMSLFHSLALKSHMGFEFTNEATGDVFSLSFKKIN